MREFGVAAREVGGGKVLNQRTPPLADTYRYIAIGHLLCISIMKVPNQTASEYDLVFLFFGGSDETISPPFGHTSH